MFFSAAAADAISQSLSPSLAPNAQSPLGRIDQGQLFPIVQPPVSGIR
jgi:hypothetical protein